MCYGHSILSPSLTLYLQIPWQQSTSSEYVPLDKIPEYRNWRIVVHWHRNGSWRKVGADVFLFYHWRDRNLEALPLLKCVLVSAFLLYPRGVPQHLFTSPRESHGIRRVPVIANPVQLSKQQQQLFTVFRCKLKSHVFADYWRIESIRGFWTIMGYIKLHLHTAWRRPT